MFDLSEFKEKLAAAVDNFKSEMSKVRTGRAHPDMLNSVKVEAYGVLTPLNQLSNITVSDATMLVITPYDINNIETISAAIRADEALSLNPSDDGRVVRVPIPSLTEERRKEIVKTAGEKVEETKVRIRGERRDTIREASGAGLPEDALKRTVNEIEDITKSSVSQIDELFKAKEAEIMKV